ncbi:MAG TPA: RES family NAD+ phosphorylase, partial [Verrucomicrobiae bacterium]|nr:RES family NAD+ phosphorylase [Verrucomicrobiae bacterium]
KRYKLFTFHFDDRLLQTFPPRNLPKNWQHEPPPPSLQRLGDDWIKSATSAILAVPSVIIPGEHNYLLNPHHPDFRKIRIDPPTDFTFDPRLFA